MSHLYLKSAGRTSISDDDVQLSSSSWCRPLQPRSPQNSTHVREFSSAEGRGLCVGLWNCCCQKERRNRLFYKTLQHSQQQSNCRCVCYCYSVGTETKDLQMTTTASCHLGGGVMKSWQVWGWMTWGCISTKLPVWINKLQKCSDPRVNDEAACYPKGRVTLQLHTICSFSTFPCVIY